MKYGEIYPDNYLVQYYHGWLSSVGFYFSQLLLGRATIHMGSIYLQKIYGEIYPTRPRKNRKPLNRKNYQHSTKMSRRNSSVTPRSFIILNEDSLHSLLWFFSGKRTSSSTNCNRDDDYCSDILEYNLSQ